MKLGGKSLRGFPVAPETSGDSTSEGVNDSGLTLPDQMPSENAVPVSGPSQDSGLGDIADAGTSDIKLPDQRSKLEDVYSQVSKADPKRAAQIVDIKSRIDAPESFIDKNLDQIQKAVNAPSPSFFKELEDQYPGTAKWLSQPKNMAVSHDDLANVASHEALIKQVQAYLGTLYDATKYGAEGSAFGLIARQQLPDEKLLPKDPDVLQRFAMGAGGLAGDFPFMTLGSAVGAPVGATAGAVAGTPGGIPGIGVGIAAGGVAGAAAGGFALPAALKSYLEQQIKDGKITSWSDIMKEATKQGFVGLLTAGAGAAAKAAFPGTALGAKTVLSTAAPLAAEVGTMTVAGKAVEGKTPTWEDLIDSSLQVGAMHYVTHALENRVQDEKAQAAKDFYTALGDTAEASKLRERLPEGYRDLVHQLTVDGPVENVYIPAEAAESYFQSKGIDPHSAMTELGVEKSYAEAKATGGDVEIPLSTWTQKLAATEHYQGLANDVKFHPEDMTVNEANQRRADVHEQVKSLLDERKARDQAQADIEAQAKKQEETTKVFQMIQEQLKAAGLSKPETEFNPKLHEAFFETMGKVMGQDPAELAKRFPLQIGRMESPESMPEFERMAAQNQEGQVLNQEASPTYSAKSVLEHHEAHTTAKVQDHVREEIEKHPEWTRVQMPLSQFEPRHALESIVEKYAELGQETSPAIIAVPRDGLHEVLDGAHRLEAARVRGESTIEAFVPKDKQYEQGAPKLVEAAPRGRIRIGREGYAIDLFKNADRSTFLHETGHYFLDVMGHIAADENAPQQIKDDFKTILDWMGVKSKEEIGTEEHEKWARAFEQYLMEGKAPSSALTRAFNRFRKWLTSVYQSTKNLNVDLSDDVRGVMDRMLASQEEIEQAEKAVGMTGDSIPGLPPELEAKIQDLQSKARDQAESALLKEQMKETTEKHKEFLASERERLTKEATDEVSELPLYKAMDEASLDIGRDARSGEGDDAPVKGARAGTIAEKFLAEKLSPEDAGKFEALAEVHGFGSGEELAQHMIMAEEGKLRQREISMRVEAGMAPHADLMKTDAIRGEALKAIHSEKMTELLALEREALSKLVHDASVKSEVSRRQRIEARVDALAAKEQARELLGQKSVKDATNATKYITAERNAAVKAAKALARKDYEAASEFKRQQMLNHAIASEAIRNKSIAEKSISYLSDYAKRGADLKDMPYGFTRQIDQLLSRSGFMDARGEDVKTLTQIAKDMASKGEDPAEIANRTGFKQDQTGAWVPETLPDFVERVNGNYYPLTLPDSVMSGGAKEYSDLTMSEIKDLRAAVKTIAEIGKKYDRFLGEFKTLDMKQAASEFASSVREKYETPFADETKAGSAYSSKFQEKIGSLKTLGSFFTRWLDTMYTTCHKLDGLEEGPAKDYIFRPFERAADAKASRTAEAMKEVEKIFSDHYDPKELKDYKESRVKVGDRYFTKENILSMALNWGNEGNKQRLLSGLGITVDQIEKAFSDHLDKTDWDFVQKTWDHIDKYWPEISKLEMDVNGVEPKKVQASPFTNQHGSYEGGYYPIAYDYDRSADAFKNAEQRDALYKQFSTAKAATEQGHTESRAQNVSRPLRLTLDVLTAHHEDVIHDLEFRKAVIDSSRFLNQKEVKGALVEALGVRGYAGILEWVKAAAADGARQEPLNPWESAANWLRMKNSVVSMGLKVASFPKIFLENINNVTSELGMTDAARAVSSYLTGSDMHEKVISNSEFMKSRAKHLDRDMADVMRKVQGETGPMKWVQQHAFFIHAYTDQAFSFPLWNFVFDKAMEEHGEKAKAVAQADEAVRRTFMSTGAVIDQPRIMRGSEYQKAMLVAYGYSSMMWNRFSLQAFDAKSQWIQGDHMAATATAAKAFVHTFMVPALVTSLTAALIHNSQSDNSDEEKKKIVADFLSDVTPLSMIPVTRDITRYGVNKLMGNHTSDLQLLPQEQAVQRLFMPLADTAMAVKSGQMNEKIPEHVANSISFVAGVPKEINDVVFNLLDYTKGQGELTYRDALSRKSKH